MEGLICFQSLINQTLDVLGHYALRAESLPVQMADTVQSQKGNLSLRSYFNEVLDLGYTRSVTIASAKIEIVIHFFFPLPHLDLPIYAMEFVAMSGKPIVAVIDAKNLLPEMDTIKSRQKILKEAHARWPAIVNDEEVPEWYTECRSGDDFFVRPKHIMDFEALSQVHTRVWQGLVTLFDAPMRLGEEQAYIHAKALKAYKWHHRVNSPGLPLMSRTFGDQWTIEFLEGYLFA